MGYVMQAWFLRIHKMIHMSHKFHKPILLKDLSRVRWNCASYTSHAKWCLNNEKEAVMSATINTMSSLWQLQIWFDEFHLFMNSMQNVYTTNLSLVQNKNRIPIATDTQLNPKMAGMLCHVHVHDTCPRWRLNLLRGFWFMRRIWVDWRGPREFLPCALLSPTCPMMSCSHIAADNKDRRDITWPRESFVVVLDLWWLRLAMGPFYCPWKYHEWCTFFFRI